MSLTTSITFRRSLSLNSMRVRFILGVLVLLLACGFQFWFASAGVFVNFILATLIAFAFFFDVWELVVFVLFAVFVINWQPAASIDIILFAIIPIIVHVLRRMFSFAPWIAMPVAVICATLILYIVIAPIASFHAPLLLATDLFGELVFSGLIFATFRRLPRS